MLGVFSKRAFSQIPLNFYGGGDPPQAQFQWEVALFHKSGGRKKLWAIGQSDNPLSKLSFETNLKLMGAGTLEFSYLDFPIDSEDYIIVSYEGNKIYRAFIENADDPKGGKYKLVPFSQRLKELQITKTYTAKTIAYIYEDVITSVTDDTGIIWNEFFVDTNSSETFTRDYTEFDTPYKIIEDLKSKMDDRNWGVDVNNIFNVYEIESNVTKLLFWNWNPGYSGIKVKNNYNKIKYTRSEVFKKKASSNETERIGQVGFGGSYPILSVEQELRKKVGKKTISEYVTNDSEALDIAYAELLASNSIPVTINVKNVNPDVYLARIGQKISVQDRDEYQQRTIINCDSITNWTGPSLDTSDYVEGSGSVQFSGTTTGQSILFDFGNNQKWNNPIKIGFMIKTTKAGNYLEWSTGDNVPIVGGGVWGGSLWGAGKWGGTSTYAAPIWTNTKAFNLASAGVWSYKEFLVLESDFRYFGIRWTADVTATINLDRVQLYLVAHPIYSYNVVQAKFDLKNGDINCNINLNEYDLQANDEFFESEKRIRALEYISANT
jgi:hypothetical protein